MSATQRPLLVVGVPRSGTTWVSTILSAAVGTELIHEPDNERMSTPLALVYKRHLHRFPYLGADDADENYKRLWELAFYGRRPNRYLDWLVSRMSGLSYRRIEQHIHERCWGRIGAAHPVIADWQWSFLGMYAQTMQRVRMQRRGGSTRSRRIVKSVHAVLALEWIKSQFDPTIIIVRRNPLNIISSYLRLKLTDADRNIFAQHRFVQAYGADDIVERYRSTTDRLERCAYQLAVMLDVLDKFARKHSTVLVVNHDAICQDPIVGFRHLYDVAGLSWGDRVIEAISRYNTEGSGEITDIRRVATREIGKWKQYLAPDQVAKIARVFELVGVPLE